MNSNIKERFINNATWIAAGRIVQLVLTFITTFLVARYLGPDKYGTITETYSYVALFIPICTLGMNDIAVKEFLDNKEKNGEILGSIIVLRFLSSMLSIGLIYVVVTLMKSNPYFSYIALLQSLALLFQIFDTIVYFYQSKLLARKTGIIYIIAYSLTAIFRIIGLIIKRDVEWFSFAVALDYLVVSVLLMIRYIKDGYKLSFSYNTAKRLLKRSSSYIFAGVMIAIYSKADNIILGKMLDETSVGYYSAATTLCNAWPFVLTAIIDSASPIIIDTFKVNRKEYEKKIKQLYATIFYVALVVAIVITLLAKLIINILYGEAYMPAVTPLRIVCWSTIFAYLGVARATWMQCENKLKYEATLAFLGAIVNVLLNIVLIKKYGINGAGLALLLTQFLTNIVFVFLIKDTRNNAKLIFNAIILKDILK